MHSENEITPISSYRCTLPTSGVLWRNSFGERNDPTSATVTFPEGGRGGNSSQRKEEHKNYNHLMAGYEWWHYYTNRPLR